MARCTKAASTTVVILQTSSQPISGIGEALRLVKIYAYKPRHILIDSVHRLTGVQLGVAPYEAANGRAALELGNAAQQLLDRWLLWRSWH
jgi:hypothetical protein